MGVSTALFAVYLLLWHEHEHEHSGADDDANHPHTSQQRKALKAQQLAKGNCGGALKHVHVHYAGVQIGLPLGLPGIAGPLAAHDHTHDHGHSHA